MAEALRLWLPRVVQAAKPWMSDEDISAGSRWLSEIQSELSQSSLGIICVTPENQASPWLLFEAGALSKALTESRVCPLLVDLAPSQLTGPLAQFQASIANREGVERILISLNKTLGSNAMTNDDLAEIVEVWWPKLEARISGARSLSRTEIKQRPLEEILEEVVANTREQLRRENIRVESNQERDGRLNEMLGVMHSYFSVVAQLQERMAAAVAQPAPRPDEVANVMRSGIIDMNPLQNMLGSLKDFAERQKVFDQRILTAPATEGANAEADTQQSVSADRAKPHSC